MAALVHTYTHSTGTTTMLQSRPTPSGRLPSNGGQAQYANSQAQRVALQPGPAMASAPALYRNSTGPMPPYAYQHSSSMPQWSVGGAGSRPQSMIAFPQVQQHLMDQANMAARPRMQNTATFTHNPVMMHNRSRDDSSLPQSRSVYSPSARPQSAYLMGGAMPPQLQQQPQPLQQQQQQQQQQQSQQQHSPLPSPSLQPPTSSTQAKPMPDRYRRPALQQQSHSQPAAPTITSTERVPRPRADSFHQMPRRAAADDMQVSMRTVATEEAKRLRRRSMHTLEASDYAVPVMSPKTAQADVRRHETPQNSPDQQSKTLRLVNVGAPSRPQASIANTDGTLAARSGHSRSSSNTSRNGNSSTDAPATHSKTEELRPSHLSARAPLAEPIRRTPSPLSQATDVNAQESMPPATSQGSSSAAPMDAAALNDSPAAKQLAALNEKNKPRRKPSRLRRALSFGSAVEFRKMTEGESDDIDGLGKDGDPLDPEQQRIAQRQEERGIGSNIYGKRFFSASTDNLSVSSTASSASIMIRKMGRGVKRTSRSLVGLFRPKSGHGPQDSSPDASQAEVSMVTVEADTQARGHVQNSLGGIGGPVQADLSITASPSFVSDRTGSGVTETSRKSVLGGDRERAEVLAAVRKGILKNTSGSSSPRRQGEGQGSLSSLDLPTLPASTDSPLSSAPSTPNDDAQAQKRADTVTIGNEDYFVAAMRLRQDTKSAPVSSPATPHGSMKRNATFSPQLIFYDTWPSQEYDRRGDVATCNRLTPLLAQQIKEELNSFKMEMEVHEKSKIYTHFF